MATPEEYLEMWLSEQVPLDEWLKILDSNPDVEKLYKKHPLFFNAVLPTLIIGFAMAMMATVMSLISYMVV